MLGAFVSQGLFVAAALALWVVAWRLNLSIRFRAAGKDTRLCERCQRALRVEFSSRCRRCDILVLLANNKRNQEHFERKIREIDAEEVKR